MTRVYERQPSECGQKIAALLRERTYITVQSYQSESLEKIVAELINDCAMQSCLELYEFLRLASHLSPPWQKLITKIAVGESYFFRDNNLRQFLTQKYFPQLINKKRNIGDHSLKIWSAGCSAGQELYSVVFILDELLPKNEVWNITAVGSDICEESIAKAKKSEYGAWSFRNIDPVEVDQFFEKNTNGGYVVKKIYQEKCEFKMQNLVDVDECIDGECGKYDLILCRNVLVYMDSDLASKISEKLIGQLNLGGVYIPGTIDTVNEDYSLAQRGGYGGLTYWTRFHPDKDENFTEKATHVKFRLPDADGEDAVVLQSETEKVKKAIPELRDAEDLNIDRLANHGMLEEAIESAELYLVQNPFDYSVKFTQALIQIELGKYEVAERIINEILLVSDRFMDVYYCAAKLAFRQKKYQVGTEYLLTMLKKYEENAETMRIVKAGELTIPELLDMARSDIDRYGRAAKKSDGNDL
ncbi:MAG: hypothetical protein OEW58_04495 [Gammaproteobacteria bacterium]|nr:hypothetical protein [Gammaproteobacteria bacterium]